MKKNILQNLKFIAFGLVLAAGIGAAAAGTWTAPTGIAPAGNIAAPLHAGPTQGKTTGTCTPANCGGLSVNTFAVQQNAEFDQQVFFKGMIRGGDPAQVDSQVKFGDSSHKVSGTIAGNASAVGALQSSGVANGQSGTLCAGKDGTIIVCAAAATQAESYTVPAQVLVHPMPDYVYTPGGERYILSVCLSGNALRNLSFTVIYTEDTGASKTAVVNIPTGQQCSSHAPLDVVFAAPHTIVGDASNACTYEGNDTMYQSPAYQGYAVSVDTSIQCAH